MKCVIILRYSRQILCGNCSFRMIPKFFRNIHLIILWNQSLKPFYNCTRKCCSLALVLFHWNVEIKNTRIKRSYIHATLTHKTLSPKPNLHHCSFSFDNLNSRNHGNVMVLFYLSQIHEVSSRWKIEGTILRISLVRLSYGKMFWENTIIVQLTCKTSMTQ